MLGVLGLILLISILIIGGDRGGMSLVALCGNLFFLSMGIWLMAEGVPVFFINNLNRGYSVLHYTVLSKWVEYKNMECFYCSINYDVCFSICSSRSNMGK